MTSSGLSLRYGFLPVFQIWLTESRGSAGPALKRVISGIASRNGLHVCTVYVYYDLPLSAGCIRQGHCGPGSTGKKRKEKV